VQKIIKAGRNLTKLWQKQFCSFFETRRRSAELVKMFLSVIQKAKTEAAYSKRVSTMPMVSAIPL